MKKILILLFVFTSPYLFAQSADKKNHDFENGDVICSSNGKILGGQWKLGENENIQNFIGVFSKPTGQTNVLMSDIFQSKGIAYVNLEAGQSISKGDYITISNKGKVVKLIGSGMYIGVALDESVNGKVKIILLSGYKN
jgi:hypothetical protein